VLVAVAALPVFLAPMRRMPPMRLSTRHTAKSLSEDEWQNSQFYGKNSQFNLAILWRQNRLQAR
jgi:hypothetical protein